MRLKDLKPNHAIHCPTLEDAEKLSELCKEYNKSLQWVKDHLVVLTHQWVEYKSNTCFFPGLVSYCSLAYAQRGDNHYEVINVKEFFKENINTMKTLEIQIPEGFVIDLELSRLDEGVVKFKPVESRFPKNWYDLGQINGYYQNSFSAVMEFKDKRAVESSRNTYPTKELVEASIALAQLLQLREKVNQGWVADWENGGVVKCCIEVDAGFLLTSTHTTTSRILAFETKDVAKTFLEMYKDLIKIAKPLL
jgi:hypothetical protein